MKFRANVISLNVLDNSNPDNTIFASTLKCWGVLDDAGKSQTLAEPIFVDHKLNQAKAEAYLTAGYAPGANVNFDTAGIAEWVENVDRTMPAKGELPARLVHRTMSPIANMVVENPRIAKNLELKASQKADTRVAPKAMQISLKADQRTQAVKPQGLRGKLDELMASVGMTRK